MDNSLTHLPSIKGWTLRILIGILFISLGISSCTIQEEPTPVPTSTIAELPEFTPVPVENTPVPELRVPGDYPSIQAAIDAAVDGDTITVAQGTYKENIDFLGKRITVRSLDPDDNGIVEETVIDGDGFDSVVTFQRGETAASILAGFTITNGSGRQYLLGESDERMPCSGGVFSSGDMVRHCGGGIVIEGASPTIENNVIRDNQVSHGGGGILVASSAFPIIRDNTISGNSASGGGGIFITNSSVPTLVGNTITDNHAVKESGGGILVTARSAPIIRENTISGNTCVMGCGIMVFNYSAATITGNTITDNQTISGAGGAIFIGTYSDAAIEENTIHLNRSNFGGGIFSEIGSTLRIIRNDIQMNTAAFGGGIDISGSHAVLSENTIQENHGTVGGGVYTEASIVTFVGNTFVENTADEGGALCLKSTSEAIVETNIFDGNIANQGGAIWLSHTVILDMMNPDDNVYTGNEPDDIYRYTPE